MVDIDSGELVSSWIVSIVVLAPNVEMKSFVIDFQSETVHKKIKFKNTWGTEKSYFVFSSNERFITVR